MPLDEALQALSHPARRAIVERLMDGEATPGELAGPLASFQISAPAISRHLRVLEKAGVIHRRIDAQRRPCRLNPEAFTALEHWLERYRARLENRYQRLDRLLATSD